MLESLDLLIEHEEAQNAMIPVRWCVRPATVERLKQGNVLHPFVLIGYRNIATGQEYRELRKLDDFLTYLTFQSPGQHELYAIILEAQEENGRDLKHFLEQEEKQYTYRLYNKEGQRVEKKFASAMGSATLPVHIDKQFFAKEPPAWLKFWCNLWFESRLHDQCHLRRRAILAFTVQPLVVGTWLALRSLIAIVWSLYYLCTFRIPGNVFRIIVYPWTYSLWDVKDDAQPWLYLKKRTVSTLQTIGALCILAALAFLFLYGAGYGVHWMWTNGLKVVVIMAIVVVLAFILFGIVLPSIESSERYQARRQRKLLQKQQAQLKASILARRNLSTQYQPLLCSSLPIVGKLTDIPAEKKTLRIHYAAMKARVCKPFAR